MPKLPRILAKIFALNAAEDDIGQFGSALTDSKVLTSDIAQIQALPAYEEGWRGAVISNRNYPTLQETNGVLKNISQQLAYLFQTGLPEWDPDTTYYANTSFCQVDSVWYQSVTDNNLGNNPTEDTSETYWKKVEFGGNNAWAYGMSQYLTEDPNSASWLASLGQYNPKNFYSDYYNWIEENVNKGTEGFKSTTIYFYTDEGDVNWRAIATPNPVVGTTVYNYYGANYTPSVEKYGEVIAVNGNTITISDKELGTTILTFKQITTNDTTAWITDYDFCLKENSFRLPLKNGNENIIDYGNYIDGVYGTEYTAPYNGFVLYRVENRATESGNTSATVVSQGIINNQIVLDVKAHHSNNLSGNNFEDQAAGAGIYRIERGQTYKLYTSYTEGMTGITSSLVRLFKAKGNGTLYYYVGGNVKNQGEIDANAAEILSKLATCVDRTVEADREAVINWAIPNRNAGIDWSAAGTYTAPATGWIMGSIRKNGSTAFAELFINDIIINTAGNDTGGNTYYYPVHIFIEKGEVFKSVYSTAKIKNSFIKFYPCKGVS